MEVATNYGVTGSYKQADKNNNTKALIKQAMHTTLHGLSRGLITEPSNATGKQHYVIDYTTPTLDCQSLAWN